MKKLLTFITLFFALLAYSDDHLPTIVAMEMYACNYNKAKDLSDSMDVVEDWNDYFDTTEIGYSAWILEPYYTNPEELYDSYWIGFAQSFEEMGAAQESMMTDEGLKIDAQFAKVSTCASHSLWGIQPVRQPTNSFGDGYLAASRCKLLDGATPMSVLAADAKWNEFMDSSGMEGGIFRWYPGPGVSSAFAGEYDFVNVNVIDSLTAFGSGADINVNGGGNMMAASIYGELMQCEDMRVYTASAARTSSN